MKDLGDKVMVNQIGPAIAKATRPLNIYVRFCNLSDVGVKALAHAIQANKTLTGFDFQYNDEYAGTLSIDSLKSPPIPSH